jgi:hypothetical protein
MSEPGYEITQEAGAESGIEVIEPIHVIVDQATEKETTPEFGSWATYSWPANTTAAASAQPILQQTRKRSKAQIIVYAGTGAAAGAFILVGSRGQVQNGQGGQLQPGRYPVENAQQLWVASDGTNAMIVVVLDERYL